MKNLHFLLLVLLSPLIAFATINEYKTDVYFGNGILTTPEQAFDNAEIVLKPAIIEKMGFLYYSKNIGKVDYAYNDTFGFGWDTHCTGPLHDCTTSRGVENTLFVNITAEHKIEVDRHHQNFLFVY